MNHLKRATPKTQVYHLEFRFYLFYSGSYDYFRFGGRHLAFPMSDNVGDESMEVGDPDNMGIAF